MRHVDHKSRLMSFGAACFCAIVAVGMSLTCLLQGEHSRRLHRQGTRVPAVVTEQWSAAGDSPSQYVSFERTPDFPAEHVELWARTAAANGDEIVGVSDDLTTGARVDLLIDGRNWELWSADGPWQPPWLVPILAAIAAVFLFGWWHATRPRPAAGVLRS